ncbi:MULTISPECIES: DoxX family protein [Bradyrhizobium]|uniref:DoxX family protein n=1 Tax=Bradyrhizobium TaxID=374 RepID=UPI000480FC2C|nr:MULTISPECIES: DoxX family protein [Bradyrhizobium]MCS3565157.1 putative oxidoreductase [Bradyrhizobium elkanii]MCW2356168.1 putative oxidoreductase [Bradyrhizobium elkanii]MDI2059647.1 DoxX family protein [Bradyrhizobium sp. Mp19]MDI2110243.1 DoxX family protein [Bradyrhizobium sp. Mp64]WLA84491.1 DoxX family protein [Bradyrhizobium elkanii]
MDQMFSKFQPVALSLFRFITGLLLFQYGVAKIFKFPVVAYFANIPPLIQAAGWLELVLGALLMLGLFSRLVAFILSGEMAFAYFLGHMFKNPAEPVFLPLLNNGTAAILFCFACLYLATSGPGPISVDAAMGKR